MEPEGKPRKTSLRQAVALRYRFHLDRAPVVTASGQGWLAERIIALAHRAGVPLVEDCSLAEALRRVDPGREIPVELYRAVAAILAFLLEADRRR